MKLNRNYIDASIARILLYASNFLISFALASEINLSLPEPDSNPQSGLMLDLPVTGKDPKSIVYENLIHLPAQSAVVSDVRTAEGFV